MIVRSRRDEGDYYFDINPVNLDRALRMSANRSSSHTALVTHADAVFVLPRVGPGYLVKNRFATFRESAMWAELRERGIGILLDGEGSFAKVEVDELDRVKMVLLFETV